MWFIWCMTFLIKFGFLFYLGSCSKKRIGKILNGSFIIIENISLHPTLFSHQPQTIKGTHKLMFGVTWVINAICPPHVGAEEEFSGCYGYSTFFFFFDLLSTFYCSFFPYLFPHIQPATGDKDILFLLPKLPLPEPLSPQAALGQSRVGKGPPTVARVEKVNALDVSDHCYINHTFC